ncbi:MAG: Crp/Fnr family transcriptional regulator [Chthoniobacterales bacterium]|nr:Crp/Fnr family transcriptional regulator [Chthoniobacterales bacterium]
MSRQTLDEFRITSLIYSLRGAFIFKDLSDADLGEIARYVVVKVLRRGEFLFHEKDPAIGFYVVRQGIINVHRVSSVGREHVIHIFRSGESLAEAALVSETGYPANARAEEDSEVLLIPKKEFMEHQRERNDLSWRMLASMSIHLRDLVSSLENFKLKDAETRFLHWLLRRCPQPLSREKAAVEIGMSKSVLAGELGTRQETLSRIFGKLRDAGLLKVRRSTISVPDPLALQALFEKNLGAAEAPEMREDPGATGD